MPLPSPQLYEALFHVVELFLKKPKHFQIQLVYRLAHEAAALTLEDQQDHALVSAFQVFAERLKEEAAAHARH